MNNNNNFKEIINKLKFILNEINYIDKNFIYFDLDITIYFEFINKLKLSIAFIFRELFVSVSLLTILFFNIILSINES